MLRVGLKLLSRIMLFIAMFCSITSYGQLPDYIASEISDASGNVVGFYDKTGKYHEMYIPQNDQMVMDTDISASSKAISTGETVITASGNIILGINAYDMVYDPYSDRIYASVQAADTKYGNKIVKVNPADGEVESSIFLGSDPRKMAISSDGKYIYVGLYGACNVVRYNVAIGEVDQTIVLGSGVYAEDIAVQPGNNTVIAVSLMQKNLSPRHAGVSIYSNGTKLPNSTSSHTGSNVIEFSDDPQFVFGYCNETTNFGVYKNLVTSNGISNISSNGSLISGFGVDIEYEDGFLYSTSGRVINTASMALAGNYSRSGALEPDASIRRTFILSNTTIYAFNQSTFLEVGSQVITGMSGSARNLIRWGNRGLAFCTTGNQIFIITSSLVTDAPELLELTLAGPSYVSSYKAQYSLTARFSDGVVQDVTKKSSWSSTPLEYSSVNGSGVLAIFGTDQPGIAEVKAQYSWAGVQYDRSMKVEYEGVVPVSADLSKLEIKGPTQVSSNTETQYSLIATFADGTQYDVTNRGLWSISTNDIATLGETGLLDVGTVNRYRDVVLTASFGHKYTELSTVFTVLCCSDLSDMSSNNWTTYQANNKHNGYVPVTLNPAEFSVRWEKPVNGTTALLPVAAANGKVFVSQSSGSNSGVSALDAADGEVLWTYSGVGGIYGINPPAYGYGNVYFQAGKGTSSNSSPTFYGLDANKGTLLFKTIFSAQWESYYAPTVYDGSVYVNGGYYGGMYGYDAFSGSQNWFLSLAQYDDWTPAIEGGRAYAYVGGTLSVVNRLYGTVEFSISDANFDWLGWSMNLAPVLGNNNNVLIIHDGRLVCFDLLGRKIAYEISGSFSGMPSVANGVVYAISNGVLQARNESDGALLWSWKSPEGVLTDTMIVTNSHVITRTSSNTYAVEILSHSQDWVYPASGPLALANESIYIAKSNGVLVSIAASDYVPAKPVKLEIIGPAEIAEKSETAYKALVTYSDNRQRERTSIASWTITTDSDCSFDNIRGILSVKELLYPQEKVGLLATYVQDGVTVSGLLDITVSASISDQQLVERNINKALGLKKEISSKLTEALVFEYADMSILKDLYAASGQQGGNYGMALRDIRSAIAQEKQARLLVDESSKKLDNILVLLNGSGAAPASQQPDEQELWQNADINTDGIVNILDLGILSRYWLEEK